MQTGKLQDLKYEFRNVIVILMQAFTGEKTQKKGYFMRKRSSSMIGSWPLYDIAIGPDLERNEKQGKAKGIFAIGDHAVGVVALGKIAKGGLALGCVAMGGIALGSVGIGVASLGGLAVGVLFAMGGTALSGGVALGGLAIGLWTAMGAVAIGENAYGAVAIGKCLKGVLEIQLFK